MTPQHREIATWKLSAAIALTRYIAEDRDSCPACDVLWGLSMLLQDVQTLITSSDVRGAVNVNTRKEICE